jgi:hypothetical protein
MANFSLNEGAEIMKVVDQSSKIVNTKNKGVIISRTNVVVDSVESF